MLVERMANSLGLPRRFIVGIANGASHDYKTYLILKRDGGSRTIHHPSRRLKALQRWLLDIVISQLPVHSAAMAYRKGVSTFDNAAVHASSSYLLRMDLQDFFPSIKRTDIETYISAVPHLFDGWLVEDIDIFCRLVCRHRALTIGAPTSPALANPLCYELDAALDTLAKRMAATYTRYSDDLFFSTAAQRVLNSIADQVPRVLQDLRVPQGLSVNVAKTRHSSKRGRRRVTGIVLGSDCKPHVGRDLKRRIRALIHQYDSLSYTQKASLAGLIAYAVGNDPPFMNSLIMKYGVTRVRVAKTMPTSSGG
jgi:RNA-directed DNA polymerase